MSTTYFRPDNTSIVAIDEFNPETTTGIARPFVSVSGHGATADTALDSLVARLRQLANLIEGRPAMSHESTGIRCPAIAVATLVSGTRPSVSREHLEAQVVRARVWDLLDATLQRPAMWAATREAYAARLSTLLDVLGYDGREIYHALPHDGPLMLEPFAALDDEWAEILVKRVQIVLESSPAALTTVEVACPKTSVPRCRYCERDACDTDCYHTDRFGPEKRLTAAEWRARGAAEALSGPAVPTTTERL